MALEELAYRLLQAVPLSGHPERGKLPDPVGLAPHRRKTFPELLRQNRPFSGSGFPTSPHRHQEDRFDLAPLRRGRSVGVHQHLRLTQHQLERDFSRYAESSLELAEARRHLLCPGMVGRAGAIRSWRSSNPPCGDRHMAAVELAAEEVT